MSYCRDYTVAKMSTCLGIKHFRLYSFTWKNFHIMCAAVMLVIILYTKVRYMESNSGWQNLKDWLKDFWNVLESFGYLLIICAIPIRVYVTGENFEYATWLYCYCLCVSYARFTQLFFVFERLGPKVIMIGKMVRHS